MTSERMSKEKEYWEETIVKDGRPVNKSGLTPCGRAVLVMPYEFKGNLIAIPETVQERTQMVETRAVVIEIGPAAWSDEPVPRAKIGDHVLISKFAGASATGTADGKQYRLINDRDIYCLIGGEQ